MGMNSLLLIHGAESVMSDRALADALLSRADFERTTVDGSELEEGRFNVSLSLRIFKKSQPK